MPVDESIKLQLQQVNAKIMAIEKSVSSIDKNFSEQLNAANESERLLNLEGKVSELTQKLAETQA
jgi:hypothetical protein